MVVQFQKCSLKCIALRKSFCFFSSLTLMTGIMAWAFHGPASSQEPLPTIVIATEAANPPFTYLDEAGRPQGFEIELGQALCEAIKAKCHFIIQDWEGMFSGLREHRFDVILSSLAVTLERSRQIAFSDRLYRIPSALMVLKDSPLTNINMAEAAFLEKLLPQIQLVPFTHVQEAALDLISGRVDGVISDQVSLTRFMSYYKGKDSLCCAITARLDGLSEGETALGLRKEDTALKQTFNQALQTIIRNGTYETIRKRYFEFDVR
jgi:polar amino acid transport system substrate-binding protein